MSTEYGTFTHDELWEIGRVYVSLKSDPKTAFKAPDYLFFLTDQIQLIEPDKFVVPHNKKLRSPFSPEARAFVTSMTAGAERA